MFRLIALLLVLAAPLDARTVTDSAGRVVEIPDRIETVFAAGPPASVLVYVLAPDRLAGWPRAIRNEERPYVAEPFADLPELGTLTGQGGEANLERVLARRPDLIIDFGSIRDTYVDLANRVQDQTGIPYLLIDGRFENTPAALRLLGDVLGVPGRGEALAVEVEATFARLDAVIAATPVEERPRTYLARGPDGLETGVIGSINTEIIERAGGINVVGTSETQRGLVQVSLENVLAWDPDTIVTWDRTFFDAVWSDPLWAEVQAVREGRVYLSPLAPFGWVDRPPSLNRMIGLQWLAGLLFPERWQGDLREETRAFYRDWYHVDLTEEDLDRLLEWARGRAS
jgi:iron complex transport system substrate-binding protein